MKHSYRLSDAVHILVYLELLGDSCGKSSKQIADSIDTNACVVRRLMAQLREAGILTTQAGVANPTLAKPSEQITLLDIYRAVEEGQLLQVDRTANARCPIGANVQQILNHTYRVIQATSEQAMAQITLQQLVQQSKAGVVS